VWPRQEDLNSFLAVAEDLYSVHKTKLAQVPNIWVRSVEVVGAASNGSGGSKRKAENVMSLSKVQLHSMSCQQVS
jgi:hypothetical protein